MLESPFNKFTTLLAAINWLNKNIPRMMERVMFDCPKSILWRISLEVMSMFRALGLMKNTGRDVCNFLSYTDNVGELVSCIHCLFFIKCLRLLKLHLHQNHFSSPRESCQRVGISIITGCQDVSLFKGSGVLNEALALFTSWLKWFGQSLYCTIL